MDDWDDEPRKKKQQPEPDVVSATPGNDVAILEARHLAEAGKGKINESSKMWHLADDHFIAIVEWILAGVPSKRISQLCDLELHLPPAKVPGRQCLSTFWSEFSPFWLVARRRANKRTIQQVDTEIEAQPLNVDAVLRDEIKQRAWELVNHPNPPEKVLIAFLKSVLTMRDQDDRQQDRELEVEKFRSSIRTKLETGLAALQDELKGNEKAMAIFAQLEDALAAA